MNSTGCLRCLFVILAITLSQTSFASEPAYCSKEAITKHEITYSHDGLIRQHVFKFGKLTLVGLAVGQSEESAVVAMAADFSPATETQKYCTWYYNDTNNADEQTFNYFYVPYPNSDPDQAADDYRSELSGVFAQNPINMLACARDYSYIAMGCDGMRHRGPTVFGMLLAYTGCTPEHALDIVDSFWQLNGINPASRLAVIQVGADLGQEQPEQAAALRALLEQ